MSVIVAGAALCGLIAGHYVRALAGGFYPAKEPEEPAEAVRPGEDLPAEPVAVMSREEAVELRRANRAEARGAFRGALRAVPSFRWPPLVELCTAVVCALVAWRLAGTAWLAAWLYAAVAGCALGVIDWRTRRLPDVITLPSYPILAALLLPTGELAAGLLGALALAGFYAVQWFLRPDALGLGDVKLAGLVGLLTGTLGLYAWVTAAVGGLLLGALYAMILLLTRRGTRQSQIPLGPFIMLGALAVVLR